VKITFDKAKRQAALSERGLDFVDAAMVLPGGSAMTVRKQSIKSDLAKLDAHRITKAEYDEAPELTRQMLDRAEIRHGNRIIKRGRPPLEHPKEAVKLRLDHDVLAAYRKTGSGWQTRINADLRKAARKLTG